MFKKTFAILAIISMFFLVAEGFLGDESTSQSTQSSVEYSLQADISHGCNSSHTGAHSDSGHHCHAGHCCFMLFSNELRTLDIESTLLSEYNQAVPDGIKSKIYQPPKA